MQPDRPSSTAELVCGWRALEYLLPEDQQIISDPYARSFLGPGRSAMLDMAERLPKRAQLALFRRIDRFMQGSMAFVLARHRAMEDLLAAQETLEQVVLLGTGYDTRGVRHAETLKGATLFEVDHPATARRRSELAKGVFGDAPRANTISVPVDFERESIKDRLLEAGFDPSRSTFWIWEGVTMYLDETSVAATLALIKELSTPGALLTFDVWCPPAGGIQKLVRRDLPALAMRLVYSEPFTWGPQLEEVDSLLRSHGLALIESVEAEALVKRYTERRPSLLQLVGCNMFLCTAEVERDI
jgi:methyltransferase (TIGR00027 family)